MSHRPSPGPSGSGADSKSPPANARLGALFACSFGACLAFALLKLGNPIIFDKLIDRPNGIWEIIFQPWPVKWGYGLLACALIASLGVARWEKPQPRWLLSLPLVWLGWQTLAALKTVDATLSTPTLRHFAACLVCFYLGWFALGRVRRMGGFWFTVTAGFVLVLWVGFEQHYGGLEAARRFFYEQPNWQQYPAEYLKKIASNRIFSTLVYPNALAGAILLLFPPVLAAMWFGTARVHPLARKVLVGLTLYGAVICLYWSGSKAGWLIALVLAIVALFQMPLGLAARRWIVIGVATAGLLGFFVKFTGYFQKGATSVGARMEYWKGALTIAQRHPVWGTGPGTFAVPFGKIKPPEAEMARLVHNDYLEQASDSGWIGFVSYSTFIFGAVATLGRRCRTAQSPLFFPTWLGLLGWTLHGFVDFSLYIPAIAWTAFALLGWLLGLTDRDK